MKRLTVLLLVLTLSSCVTVKVNPPKFHEIEKNKDYNLPYDTVWIQVVDWFADHNVTIDKIEKGSGLITAKYQFEVSDNYLDCGDIKVSNATGKPDINKIGTVNVTVRSIGPEKTKVNVNFFGKYVVNAYDGWNTRMVTSDGRCISNGLIEKSVLSSIK